MTNETFLTEHLNEENAEMILIGFQVKYKWPPTPYKWDDLKSLIAEIYESGFQDGYQARIEGK